MIRQQLEVLREARQWAACQLLAGESAIKTLEGVRQHYLAHLPYALQAVEGARLLLTDEALQKRLTDERSFWQTAWLSPQRVHVDRTSLPESQDESFRLSGDPLTLDLVVSLPGGRVHWLENVPVEALAPIPDGVRPLPLGLIWLEGEAFISYELAPETVKGSAPLVKAAACALATLTPLTAVAPPVFAAPPANANQERGIYYVVGQGETLRTIARDVLGDEGRWREIYELNKAKVPNPPQVRPGVSLLLPAPQAPRRTPAPQATQRPTPKPTGRPTPKPTVRPTPKQTVRPTARPTVRPTPRPTARIQRPAVRPQPVVTGERYTVRRGDSLWSIAGRVLGSPYRWTQLYQANRGRIANPNVIYPGQTLVVRGTVAATDTYTVRRGDSLWHIANRELGNPVRWIEIYRLNRDKIANPNLIFAGQRLRLPVARR